MDLLKPLSEKSNQIFEQNISIFKNVELFISNSWKMEFLQTEESYDLFSATKSQYVIRFLKKNPTIETMNDLLKTFEDFQITYTSLDDYEREQINKVLSRFNISEEDCFRLINLIGAYFLVNDLRLFQNSPVVAIIKDLAVKMFLRMKQIQSIIRHNIETIFLPIIIEQNELELAKSELDLAGFAKLLKSSPGKKGNMPLNNLVAEIVAIGRKNYPDSNLSEFSIPFLQELKDLFPKQFEGISKFKKDYLLTKALDWKYYLEEEELREQDAQRLATRDIIT